MQQASWELLTFEVIKRNTLTKVEKITRIYKKKKVEKYRTFFLFIFFRIIYLFFSSLYKGMLERLLQQLRGRTLLGRLKRNRDSRSGLLIYKSSFDAIIQSHRFPFCDWKFLLQTLTNSSIEGMFQKLRWEVELWKATPLQHRGHQWLALLTRDKASVWA